MTVFSAAAFREEPCQILSPAVFHGRNSNQLRFDNPARCRGFREGFRQIRREAVEARMRVVHVGFGQPDIGATLLQAKWFAG